MLATRIRLDEDVLRYETALAVANIPAVLLIGALVIYGTRRGLHITWGELLGLLPGALLGVALVWLWSIGRAIELEDEELPATPAAPPTPEPAPPPAPELDHADPPFVIRSKGDH